MPLSNWDALAFDENAESCLAQLFHPSESIVYLHKSQLILKNDEMGIMLNLDSGSFLFEDMVIIADRARNQSGVFFIATYYDEDLPEDEDKDEDEESSPLAWESGEIGVREMRFRLIAGLGCEGYRSNAFEILAKRGIRIPEELAHFIEIAYKYGEEQPRYIISYPDDEGDIVKLEEPITDETLENDRRYIGATPEIYMEFLEWLERTVVDLAEFLDDPDEVDFYEDWLEKVKNKVALRYNQGDAFLMEAEELSNLACTRIGAAKSPMLDVLVRE